MKEALGTDSTASSEKVRKPLHLRLRDGLRYRLLLPLAASWRRRRARSAGSWATTQPNGEGDSNPVKLHVGSGRHAFPGWVNTDIQAYPEVDLVLDITEGIPFERLQAVYSEHFLEHLDVEAALQFLADCNRLLVDGGWLRLSTPNLDWVWTHVYSARDEGDRLVRGIHANRSFYGWRHRFLWNRELLETALRASGFSEIRFCEYGVSSLPDFHGRERHETYLDNPQCPHVLIVEAREGALDPAALEGFRQILRAEFHDHMAD